MTSENLRSLLVVTADPDIISALERCTTQTQMRAKSVTTLDDARRWLEIQSFELVALDTRFGEGTILQFFEEIWRKRPLVQALALATEPVADELGFTIAGVTVITGPDLPARFEAFLRNLVETADAAGLFSTVLVVEDLDAPREIICAYIEALGYTPVTGVGSADEALALLQERPLEYFCVITDIAMPKMSGIELTREIRSDPTLKQIPVVALTANPTSDNLVACLKAGITGFLAKPPHKKALSSELDRARRITLHRLSPRLCKPEDAEQLDHAMMRLIRS